MDPISHAVFGPALAIALRRRACPLRARVLPSLLGALAVDVDSVLMPVGWDIYLRAHEIGTHSIAGSLPVAAAAALAARPFVYDRHGFALFAWAWLGCLSHIALDVLSGARIQIGWPFLSGRVSLPLVAMADPWLLAILVIGGLALSLAEPRGRFAWGTIAASTAFLGVKGMLLSQALLDPVTSDNPRVSTRIVEAQWGSLKRWRVFERDHDTLTEWQIEPGKPPLRLLSLPVAVDLRLILASRSLDTVRNFFHVHELGFAIERPSGDGTSQVLWSDVRFCRAIDAISGDSAPDPTVSIVAPAGDMRIACSLWFGGVFEQDGRAVRQLVKIGGWWQTRAP